jgi:adenylate cyclase
MPLVAFERIALACLDHLQRNHAGAISTGDPEYIHQMRVATRRLRAALRLFGPLLPAGLAETLVPDLRELMGTLGQARDYDVLLAEIAQPVLQALPDEPRLAALVGIITARGFDVRQDAVRMLASQRYGSLVLHVLANLYGISKVGLTEANPFSGTGGTATDANTISVFAEDRLRRLRKKVLTLATHARIKDPASLHALRIGIKRLRYALEFFAPLASVKEMRRMLAQLACLQEILGHINDLANAGELLMACADDDPRLREAVTLIGGWHGPRHHGLLASVPKNLQRLGKLRLPVLKQKKD